MKKIDVKLIKTVDNSYPILIEQYIFSQIPEFLKNKYKSEKILIVSDSNVTPLYAETLYHTLKKSSFNTYLFSIPAGERYKNLNTKTDIENYMFENNFTRDSLIIALGGGVVGDISGFVAATFNRGIPYIQIPTTIVAQVDSSIGGKTAIDVPHGKNLIGAFYQPTMVIIDPEVLKTLPENEYISGMAEVIKHAIIYDVNLFKILKENLTHIKQRNLPILSEIIARNCEIKKSVVEQDEKEMNLRKILNFGHTIGHAIEKLLNYQSLHGECVALGMIAESQISSKMGYLPEKDYIEIKDLIHKINLP